MKARATQIDVRAWKRDGVVKPGSLVCSQWTPNGAPYVKTDVDMANRDTHDLTYTLTGRAHSTRGHPGTRAFAIRAPVASASRRLSAAGRWARPQLLHSGVDVRVGMQRLWRANKLQKRWAAMAEGAQKHESP